MGNGEIHIRYILAYLMGAATAATALSSPTHEVPHTYPERPALESSINPPLRHTDPAGVEPAASACPPVAEGEDRYHGMYFGEIAE